MMVLERMRRRRRRRNRKERGRENRRIRFEGVGERENCGHERRRWRRKRRVTRKKSTGTCSVSEREGQMRRRSAIKNKKKKTTRSRGQSREDVHGAYKAHKERYSKAITCEFEEEREQFKERLESWTLARLKNEGYCLTDMRARYEDNLGR